MEDKIVILGTGTCNYEIEKASTSLLICSGKTKIVYDFGYKVFHKLKQLGYSNDDIEHIIISHFHPDHFSDLIPFLHSCFYSKNKRNKVLKIYSNENIYEFMDVIKKILPEPPFFSKLVKMYHLKENEKFKISDIEIFSVKLSHFNNIGISFSFKNKKISITGDFNPKDNLEFLLNSDYCFMNVGDLNVEEIINLKKQLKIKYLIALHCYKNIFVDHNDKIIIGREGMEFSF